MNTAEFICIQKATMWNYFAVADYEYQLGTAGELRIFPKGEAQVKEIYAAGTWLHLTIGPKS